MYIDKVMLVIILIAILHACRCQCKDEKNTYKSPQDSTGCMVFGGIVLALIACFFLWVFTSTSFVLWALLTTGVTIGYWVTVNYIEDKPRTKSNNSGSILHYVLYIVPLAYIISLFCVILYDPSDADYDTIGEVIFGSMIIGGLPGLGIGFIASQRIILKSDRHIIDKHIDMKKNASNDQDGVEMPKHYSTFVLLVIGVSVAIAIIYHNWHLLPAVVRGQ